LTQNFAHKIGCLINALVTYVALHVRLRLINISNRKFNQLCIICTLCPLSVTFGDSPFILAKTCTRLLPSGRTNQ
jgi:hypothetical protein